MKTPLLHAKESKQPYVELVIDQRHIGGGRIKIQTPVLLPITLAKAHALLSALVDEEDLYEDQENTEPAP